MVVQFTSSQKSTSEQAHGTGCLANEQVGSFGPVGKNGDSGQAIASGASALVSGRFLMSLLQLASTTSSISFQPMCIEDLLL